MTAIAKVVRVVAAGVLVAVAAAGCCNIVDDRSGGPPAQRRKPVDPKGQPTDVDLGLAGYPTITSKSKAAATRHRFQVPPLVPDTYRIAYALDEREAASVRGAFRKYASDVGFEARGSDKFNWTPPDGCRDDLHCVYDQAATRDVNDLKPLAELFRRRAKASKLSSMEAAELVIAFVQSIRYEIPRNEPFGLLVPSLVAWEKRGDCDSKALLALVLLHHLGVDAVLVESQSHHHAMLGIALPAPGASFKYNGRRYALAETTAIGWPIGQIAPQLLYPNDWQGIPVRFDAGAPKKGTKQRQRRHRR